MIAFIASVGIIVCIVSYTRHKAWLTLLHAFYYLILLTAPKIQLPIFVTFILVIAFTLYSLYQLMSAIFATTRRTKLEWSQIGLNLLIVAILLLS